MLEKDVVKICAKEYGQIVDINLHSIKEFEERIDKEGIRRGLISKKGYRPKPIEFGTIDDAKIEISEKETLAERAKSCIYRTYGDTITEKDNLLATYDKRVILDMVSGEENQDLKERLNDIILKAFRIGKLPPSKFKYELGHLRDNTIISIREGLPKETEDNLNIFEDLIKKFIETLRGYGIRYSSEEASKVSFFDDWTSLRAIEDHYHDVLEGIIKSEDLTIINTGVYSPANILYTSLDLRDHLIFQRFLGYYPHFYKRSFQVKNGDIKRVIFESSFRHLDTLSISVGSRLEESDDLEEIADLLDYAIEILKTYESLLKKSLDRNDIEAFKSFSESLDAKFKHFHPDTQPLNLDILRNQLETFNGSEKKKNKLQKELNLKEKKIFAQKRIEQFKKEIYFGIGGWVIQLYQHRAIDKKFFKVFFNKSARAFDNLEDLSDIFFEINVISPERNHLWTWWELKNKSRYGAHSVDVMSWLSDFYCIVGIKLTTKEIGREQTPIKPSRELVSRLDRIKLKFEPINQYRFIDEEIITKDELKRIPNFLILHERAVEIQLKKEAEWLIKQKLSEKKVNEFKKEVLNSWGTRGILREIIKKYGAFSDKTNESVPVGIPEVGINVVDDKAAYMEDWHVGYPDWGKWYGINICRGEDKAIFDKICNALKRNKIPPNKLLRTLNDSINKLKEKGYDPIVIFSWDIHISENQEESDDLSFIPRWDPECPLKIDLPSFEGACGENTPVFKLLYKRLEKSICVVDIKKLGKLIQYKPHEDADGPLFFSVVPFDDKKAEELIKRQPDFKKDKDGKIMKKEDAIFHLKQKVHLRIYEKYEFKIEDKKAGIRIDLEGESE